MRDTAEPEDALERIWRLIEASPADSGLQLADLSAAAGASVFHFSRMFQARFGVSPMARLRGRRLAAAAARLLAEPAPVLAELAFDSGYESQAAFTRAFTRVYGVAPGRFRRERAASPFQEIITMRPNATPPPGLTAAGAPLAKPALRLAGLERTFTDETKAQIPDLWDVFFARLPFDGQAGWETFGVCRAPLEGQDAALRYAAAAPLGADAAAPDGFEVIEIPARRYLVFRQVIDGGPLHPQMQAALAEIWGRLAPASGVRLARAPDLEVYPADFRPDQAGCWVEWWLPVEDEA